MVNFICCICSVISLQKDNHFECVKELLCSFPSFFRKLGNKTALFLNFHKSQLYLSVFVDKLVTLKLRRILNVVDMRTAMTYKENRRIKKSKKFKRKTKNWERSWIIRRMQKKWERKMTQRHQDGRKRMERRKDE